MDQFDLSPFIREPGDVYRARRDEYLTSHQLLDFAACPLLYKKKQAGLVSEPRREAYLVGAAAHCLTLEGRAEFESHFQVGGPINPKTDRPYGRETKAYADWEREQAKACLSDEQFALVCSVTSAVQGHAIAAELLRHGCAEGVLRGDFPELGLKAQARFDWFSPTDGIIDLKTCEDLDRFEEDAKRFGYACQMAFYRTLYYLLTKRLPPVRLIAVEKREPYRVGVWRISDTALNGAEQVNAFAIRELKRSRQSNVWPTGYESERTIGA